MNRMLRVTSTVLVAMSATPFPMHYAQAKPEISQQKSHPASIPRSRASLRNHSNLHDAHKPTSSHTIYALANHRIVKITEGGASFQRVPQKPRVRATTHKTRTVRTREAVETTNPVARSSAPASRSVSLTVVVGGSQRGLSIAKLALELVGRPYRWGGESPAGFDCSGLIQYVYQRDGIQMPRTSFAQYTVGRPVAWRDLRPGDLVFFSTDASGASHVAIYVGNGLIVQALNSETGVIVSHLDDSYYVQHFIGARRPY